MVRGIHKLSEKECAQYIKAGKRGVLNDGGGLYLCVGASGTASWIFRYEQGGRRHDIGLGAVHTFSLAEVREKARLARQQLHNGQDPLSEKRRAKLAEASVNPASKPFYYCAQEFIKSREGGWRNDKHRKDWENSLSRYAYPVLRNRLVSDITTEHVLKVLEPHWATKTETMTRVRGRIELVLDWATAKKFRTGPNPATWTANLDAVLDRHARPKTVNHAALEYIEVPALVADAQQDPHIAAAALNFTILTALRTNEVLQLQWDYIASDNKSLTIPAEAMKMNRPHRVPLSPPALAIIEALGAVRTASPYVFTSGTRGKPLPARALRDALQRLRPKADVTVHGMRAAFATWRAEETSFSEEVAEACLAHAKKDKVAEAYNRGGYFEKRTEVMAAWARFCCTPPGDNVTALRRVA